MLYVFQIMYTRVILKKVKIVKEAEWRTILSKKLLLIALHFAMILERKKSLTNFLIPYSFQRTRSYFSYCYDMEHIYYINRSKDCECFCWLYKKNCIIFLTNSYFWWNKKTAVNIKCIWESKVYNKKKSQTPTLYVGTWHDCVFFFFRYKRKKTTLIRKLRKPEILNKSYQISDFLIKLK